MACGISVTTGLADADIDDAVALSMVDNPLSTSLQSDGHGGWNLTCVFNPCSDGSDPLTTAPASNPAAKTVLGSASTTPATFIQAHLADAQAVKRQFKIPIAVTLAQSALETGWGRSVVGNAYFGIKASAGQTSVTTTTHEYENGQRKSTSAAFCSFANYTDAAMYYGRFLTTNSRYALAFQHTDDPEAFAQAIANAHFATSPTYGNSLVRLMRENDLEKYDRV